MRLHIRDFKEDESHFVANETDKWLRDLIEKSDEVPPSPDSKKPFRTAALNLSTRKVGDVLWIEGELKSSVILICSATGEEFEFPFSAKIRHLYSQNPELTINSDTKGQGKYQIGSNDWEAQWSPEIEPLVSNEVEMEPIISEAIGLEIPMRPLSEAGRSMKETVVLDETPIKPPTHNPFSELLKDVKVSSKKRDN